MKTSSRTLRPLRRRGAARVVHESASAGAAGEDSFVEHPDGWYWIAPDGKQQFGPFESCALARADRDRSSSEMAAGDDEIREVERVAGIVERADDETGPPDEDEIAAQGDED